MSCFSKLLCLKCRFVLAILLIFQLANAQSGFEPLTAWMQKNIEPLGGRAVLLVYKNGEIVYSESVNQLNKRQEIAAKIAAVRQGISTEAALSDFTPTTRLRIASSSKWLTAVLAMTFVDEGKLRLQDTIGKYLPIMSKYGKGQIRVWHCLSHLTGIKQGGLRETLDDLKSIESMSASIEQIARLPMEGEPGLSFHYGNAGMQIIAAIIEKIGGANFETLFAQRIAEPLEMKATDFGKTAVPLAAGGAWSTPEDYMKLLAMLLNEGMYKDKRILSKAAINEMMKNRIRKDCLIAYRPEELGEWEYGFGAWVLDGIAADKRSMQLASPGLFGSFPWIDASNNYCAFLLTMNMRTKGRKELYEELVQLTTEAVKQLR